MMEKKYRFINYKIRVYLCKNFIFFNMFFGNSLINDIYIYIYNLKFWLICYFIKKERNYDDKIVNFFVDKWSKGI